MIMPTSHGDKLKALLQNEKLPNSDRTRIDKALERYHDWIEALRCLPTGNSGIAEAVRLLNDYRLFLDLDVVFDSEDDFLYRQKG